MLKLLAGLLGLGALGYFGVCVALFAFQRSLLYFPQPRGGPPAEEIKLPGSDADVRVLVREHDGPQALLYFGGNAEDVSQSLPALAQAFPDRAIYLMNYRGYGGSGGSPSESALRRDALALHDLVRASHPQVSAIGRSLGTGLAVQLAGERPLQRLVLVTPYDSILSLAAAQFRWFPVRWLLQDRYESSRHAPQVTAPTTLIMAAHDEVIPRASTERLLASFAPGVARLVVIDDAGHNDISQRPGYLRALQAALPPPP